MKLNNRKFQVHGIGLNMRETHNWGTPLEVFGEKIPTSIAVIVNSFLTPFCVLNHSVVPSSDLYLNKQSLGGKKKVSMFLNFTAEPSRLG